MKKKYLITVDCIGMFRSRRDDRPDTNTHAMEVQNVNPWSEEADTETEVEEIVEWFRTYRGFRLDDMGNPPVRHIAVYTLHHIVM